MNVIVICIRMAGFGSTVFSNGWKTCTLIHGVDLGLQEGGGTWRRGAQNNYFAN